MIKYILLGFLNYRPATGYDLKQIIDHSTAHFWHAHHSQIYTTLRKMEEEELVTSVLVKEDNVPERRIYSITDEGRKTLDEWLGQSMTETARIKEELLVRVFFSARRDPQEVLAELYLQRQLHQEKLKAYQHLIETIPHIEKGPGMEKDPVFWQATLEMGMRFEEMYLDWLSDTIQTIETL